MLGAGEWGGGVAVCWPLLLKFFTNEQGIVEEFASFSTNTSLTFSFVTSQILI